MLADPLNREDFVMEIKSSNNKVGKVEVEEFLRGIKPIVDAVAHQKLPVPLGSLTWEDLSSETMAHIWQRVIEGGKFKDCFNVGVVAKNYMANMLRHEKVEKKVKEKGGI